MSNRPRTTMVSAAFLSLVAVCGSARLALAEETIDVSDFRECRAIAGKAERLLCYDTLADGGVFNTQKLEQVQRENFGNSARQPDISIDSLNVTVVKIQKDGNGMLYFITDTGEAWKQQNRGAYNTQVPFDAEIRSGMMGSYFLVNEQGNGIRVKRVK